MNDVTVDQLLVVVKGSICQPQMARPACNGQTQLALCHFVAFLVVFVHLEPRLGVGVKVTQKRRLPFISS